jgi:hypothetical protein
MQGMGGMQQGAAAGAGCAAQGPDAGLAALFDKPIGLIHLTETQRTELQGILADARAQAMEKLTLEQRGRLEIAPSTGPGMCGAAAQPASPSH